MKSIRNLHDLLVEQLQDLHDGNLRQLKFLNKIADKPESTDLQASIAEYTRETKRQKNRLDQIFILLNEDAGSEPFAGIKMMILETNKLLNRCHNKAIADAALITAIQHINHYEIAGYGTAIAYAKVLELHDVGQILLDSLRECKLADAELSQIAIEEINRDAKQPEAILKVNEK